MKILWLTWKDSSHPLAGGAEIVHDELAKRLAKDGHEVVFIVPRFAGSAAEETRDGYKVLRVGNSVTVYWKAYKLYKKQFQGWPDLVIDSYFVLPFFTKFYVKEKNILLVHNLCRQIWFYQMFFPASLVGYLLEPLYLWLIRDRKAVTISQSTKNDMVHFGFSPNRVHIISEGINLTPLESLEGIQKFANPTLLALGSIRPMKRTDQIIKTFEIAKQSIPNLELIIAGKSEGKYGKKILEMIKNSFYSNSIFCIGPVSKKKKVDLMQKAHLICVTSVKEGWGLIVTEAASQGTPSVVYNADGLRDSVRDGETGLVCVQNTPANLAVQINTILGDPALYERLRTNAWEWSKKITFDNSYRQFADFINHT